MDPMIPLDFNSSRHKALYEKVLHLWKERAERKDKETNTSQLVIPATTPTTTNDGMDESIGSYILSSILLSLVSSSNESLYESTSNGVADPPSENIYFPPPLDTTTRTSSTASTVITANITNTAPNTNDEISMDALTGIISKLATTIAKQELVHSNPPSLMDIVTLCRNILLHEGIENSSGGNRTNGHENHLEVGQDSFILLDDSNHSNKSNTNTFIQALYQEITQQDPFQQYITLPLSTTPTQLQQTLQSTLTLIQNDIYMSVQYVHDVTKMWESFQRQSLIHLSFLPFSQHYVHLLSCTLALESFDTNNLLEKDGSMTAAQCNYNNMYDNRRKRLVFGAAVLIHLIQSHVENYGLTEKDTKSILKNYWNQNNNILSNDGNGDSGVPSNGDDDDDDDILSDNEINGMDIENSNNTDSHNNNNNSTNTIPQDRSSRISSEAEAINTLCIMAVSKNDSRSSQMATQFLFHYIHQTLVGIINETLLSPLGSIPMYGSSMDGSVVGIMDSQHGRTYTPNGMNSVDSVTVEEVKEQVIIVSRKLQNWNMHKFRKKCDRDNGEESEDSDDVNPEELLDSFRLILEERCETISCIYEDILKKSILNRIDEGTNNIFGARKYVDERCMHPSMTKDSLAIFLADNTTNHPFGATTTNTRAKEKSTISVTPIPPTNNILPQSNDQMNDVSKQHQELPMDTSSALPLHPTTIEPLPFLTNSNYLDIMPIDDWVSQLLTTARKKIGPSPALVQIYSLLENEDQPSSESSSSTPPSLPLLWREATIPILKHAFYKVSGIDNVELNANGEMDISSSNEGNNNSINHFSFERLEITRESLGRALLAFYYQSLEAILRYESSRLNRATKPKLRRLVMSLPFHRALLSICHVCIVHATDCIPLMNHDDDVKNGEKENEYELPCHLPCILRQMDCTAYEYLKVSESFLTVIEEWTKQDAVFRSTSDGFKQSDSLLASCPLSIRELLRIMENMILESLVWAPVHYKKENSLALIDVIEKFKAGNKSDSCSSYRWPPTETSDAIRRHIIVQTKKRCATQSQQSQTTTSLSVSTSKNDANLFPEYIFVQYLMRKFQKIATARIAKICVSLEIPPEYPIVGQIWSVFQSMVACNVHLLYHRHVDQLILCCLYGVCKAMELKPGMTFKRIFEAYSKMNHTRFGKIAGDRITQHIKKKVWHFQDNAMLSSNDLQPTNTSDRKESKEEKEYIGIIQFYNTVFVADMKRHLLRNQSLKVASFELMKCMSKDHKKHENNESRQPDTIGDGPMLDINLSIIPCSENSGIIHVNHDGISLRVANRKDSQNVETLPSHRFLYKFGDINMEQINLMNDAMNRL